MTKPFNIVCEDYTVYLMVGPTNVGKSTLCKNIQLDLAKSNVDSRILSTDNIRRDLIGDINISKYDPKMQEVSSQAFDLLYSTLRSYISYPVNVPIVFIDSTGLSDSFRKDIISIAKSNSYKVVCILFDYNEREDWFLYDGGDRFVINKHLEKMQKHVFKEIKAKDYHSIVRVNHPIKDIKIQYVSTKDNLTVLDNNYTVIGDVHSCVEELKEMLTKIDNTPILVGDWIDYKGDVDLEESTNHNKAIIDFLIDNPQILLVKGNHEENLYNQLDKEYKYNKYFNSRYLISTSKEYKNKFVELYNRSYVSIKGKGFIVTHAPCKAKYLLRSKNEQINIYYTQENKCEIINDIYNNINYNNCWPLHLFGHLTFDKPIKTKYCIGLDTGVGYGGTLTGFDISKHKFVVVESKQTKQIQALTKFTVLVKDLTSTLDDDSKKKLYSFIRNQTPYISGTMCPADKSEFVLEDIRTALNYYKSCGQTKVLIQPKFMGSRAQLLLNKEDNKYEVYSRNGFRLKHTLELDNAVNKFQDSLSDELVDFINWNNEAISVLFDCELMPWYYLGKRLIDNEFNNYLYANKTHINYFKEFGLYTDLIEAKNKQNPYLCSWKYINSEKELNIFETELNKYSADLDPYFVPFNILKIESSNSVLYSNSDFNKFNNKELLSLLPCDLHEIDIDNIEEALKIQSLYKDIEGIVIKPFINYNHQAPYIKVRNTDYLRLIYGHDYTLRLDKWIEKKHINSKLKLSIKEWQLGNNLLDIHSSLFTQDNQEYTNNLISLMFELNKESSLDPRL